MAERPTLMKDKGGKLIDTTDLRLVWLAPDSGFETKKLLQMAGLCWMSSTRRKYFWFSSISMDIGFVSFGPSKMQKSTAISTTEAEYIALSGIDSAKSSDAISTSSVQLSRSKTLIFVTTLSKSRALRDTPPLLGVKYTMSPETLKELQDESVSE
ncbi:hypothetical protein Tco_0647925 [Tanacetum coccineum]